MTAALPTLTVHFLLALSLGTAAFSWIADPKATGAGFMRLITGHGFIALAIALAMDFALRGNPAAWTLNLYVAGLLALGMQWRFHPDDRTPMMWVLFATQVVVSLRLLFAATPTTPEGYLFVMTSAVLLGITHYAMLLGHYYLVVPKLSERPLLVALRLFWAIVIVKIVWSAMQTWAARDYLVEGTMAGDGYTFNWLVISMRWLWGYGALGVLSIFAWRLCRMRSIQSATGVLYIMVFFVFVGELISGYLFFKHGLAI